MRTSSIRDWIEYATILSVKVLEWGGVPLTERSFEEVCAVLERGGDSVELLVEPAPQLDDQPAQPSQGSHHHHGLYGTRHYHPYLPSKTMINHFSLSN